ncbi:MAG TPA: carbohydrate porin, partial [Bacteroidia bacterium]
ISAGKFCIADYYDDNKFSHDCRTQFMNWSLMDNTGWDYPSNTRGYTWGMVAEFFRPKWAARISSVLVPTEPNGMELDENFTKAHSETFEAERKLSFGKHSGKIRLLLYHTISKAPNYRDAINAMSHGDSSLIPIFEGKQEWDTYGGQKYGYGISFDHEITDNIGFFARTSWNDGHTSIWAFTEVDQSVSGGISICMKKLKRPDDNLGIAFAVDDISNDHRDYLNAGGKTFDLGDGKLTRYGLEQIIETYYRCRLHQTLWLSLGYQYMINPGYNKDRGPVNVVSVRVHAEI